MENEPTNLNTESNDIAGNRKDGPVGNTAARPGPGVGIPGGEPASDPAAPASPEVNPADQPPPAAYGGDFGNSTQSSYRDQDRRENQDSNPNRGEFGVQDSGGTTHGGFGNQNRLADYEPADSAEDRYYGGPGRSGPQDNAYRAYDGRDERPDSQSDYGFEPGTPAPAPDFAAGQPMAEQLDAPDSAVPNDNGSPTGPGPGYANDYGHTSRPAAAPGAASPAPERPADQRNQTDDYLPAPDNAAEQRPRAEQHPGYSTNDPDVADQRNRPAQSRPNPELRTGYVQAPGGDSAQGLGSRGGSYNDAYDDSQPGSTAGSPAKGDQRREDADPSYGPAAREQNRTAEDNEDDHGAPRRNAGRTGEGDE